MTEKELIRRCIKQDKWAQKHLYDKYASLMLGICSRYTGTITEAEDIIQEGFLKIFLNIKEFTGKGSFEGWMKRVMINTAITHYHKNLKYQYHYDIEEIREFTTGDKEYEDSEFTNEELLNVIKSLPEGYRMVFNLFAVEGYKHKEIADMMGVDINTSKSQYSRARKIIQKKLLDLKKIKYGTEEQKYRRSV